MNASPSPPRASRLASAALALTAVCLPASAGARITPEARAVVDRYVEATGGRRAWEAVRTQRSLLTLEALGLVGRVETWEARPDRAATVTHIGPLTIREGAIGARAWRTDQNGTLHWLDDRELADARASAYFTNEMWASADQGGGDVRVEGRRGDGADARTVLLITPPVGRASRLAFDVETGLLVREESEIDIQKVTTTLSDYAPTAGRRLPRTRVTHIEGMAVNDFTVRLDSVWVNEPLDSLRFLPEQRATAAGAGGGGSVYRFTGSARRIVVPIRYSARHVWLRVEVNGQPGEFLLDTGASTSCLDSAWAAAIGVTSEGEANLGGAGGQGRFRLARVASLRVAGDEQQGVEGEGRTVAVLALNRYVGPAFWRDVHGILGYDFVSQFVTTLDYEHEKLILEDPASFTSAGRGTAVPLTFAQGIPVVRATVNGRWTGDFRLDVGSGNGVDIHGPFAEAHGLEKKVGRTVPVIAGGVGGVFTQLACRFRSFTVGPYTVKEPLGALSRARTGALASRDYAGNVGNLLLDHFTCTFDYGRKVIYLEPNARFAARDPVDKMGLAIARDAERYEVLYVVPGSAAERAGVRPGDELRALAGRPLASYTVDEVRKLGETSPDGARVRLDLVRDGAPRTVELTLKGLL